MNKKIILTLILILLVALGIISFLLFSNNTNELQTIKSEKQLSKIYDDETLEIKNTFIHIISAPFSLLFMDHPKYAINDAYLTENSAMDSISSSTIGSAASKDSLASVSKDYSTTNIQVENVDEADITKTDGDFIYSISDNNVIITDVRNPEEIKIATTIPFNDGSVPEDLILHDNTLVIISSKITNSSYSSYSRSSASNTVVKIYNISNKFIPVLQKSYELYEPYYTSRRIDNTLYVISCGNLRKENDKIVRAYSENNEEREIDLNEIKYLKDVNTKKQTLISVVDLSNPKKDISVDSYLIDISNAYVSENSIYLLNQKYDYDDDVPPIKSLFTLKGIFGPFVYYSKSSSTSGYYTEIYKFNLNKGQNINYSAKNKILGKTINQYSLDEKNSHLRIALSDTNGSRIVIFDEGLKEIGSTQYVAKGENMYSSRFMGNKAYLVTYKTTDPLWVIDLSNEKKPEILGELSIPGYSTYLHPYDETHLIGIGMETEEVVNKNSSGKVISTTSKIIGMKMALFDVSEVNQPKQISEAIIGDRRTTSAILTNPKALLFSAQKGIIAIPVNNYTEDFEINSSSTSYSSIVNSYTSYNKPHIAEGYFVYNINLVDGFNLKGIINHDTLTTHKYSYYATSRLLRGLYIDSNLFTVSETAVKVNNIDTLEQISELKITNK